MPRQLSRTARNCRRSREKRRIFPALIIAVEADEAVSVLSSAPSFAPSFQLGVFSVAFQVSFHFQDKIKHCFPPHLINLQGNCRPRSWPETKAVKFATFRVIFVRKGKRKERNSWMEFRSLELSSLLVVDYGCLANADNLELGCLAALLASS